MTARVIVLSTIAFLGLAGCAERAEPTRSIELTVNVTAPPDMAATGTVHVAALHAWELQGDLRHPRGEIQSFEAKVGSTTHTLSYPTERGEGLLVYAWLDSDGDGVHCTPTARTEPAGLVEVKDFPADRVVANVELTQPCRGADWFYP